jgi:hypothetical protein
MTICIRNDDATFEAPDVKLTRLCKVERARISNKKARGRDIKIHTKVYLQTISTSYEGKISAENTR